MSDAEFLDRPLAFAFARSTAEQLQEEADRAWLEHSCEIASSRDGAQALSKTFYVTRWGRDADGVSYMAFAEGSPENDDRAYVWSTI